MSYTALSHVATGDMATASLQNQLLDNSAYFQALATQAYTRSPAAPAGTTSGTPVMMGLAGTFTPTSARMVVTITGTISNDTSGDYAVAAGRFGTGSAPANAAADAGTLFGKQVEYQAGAGKFSPFCIHAVISGLTIGTVYWVDIALFKVTGGTAAVLDLYIAAH